MGADYSPRDQTNLNDSQLNHIGLAMSVAGSVGVLIAGMILIALLCAKAYKTILQRLFLYTVLSLIVHDSSHVASIHHLLTYNETSQHKVCQLIGFVANWSSWCINMFYLAIIICLLVMVCMQTRGAHFRISRFLRTLFELGLILFLVIGPALILWVPLYKKQYGYDNGYCWIKALNTSSDFLIRMSYGYSLYELSGLIAVVIAFGIIIAYCAYSAKLQHARRMIKHLLMLIAAVIVYMILLNIELATDTNHHASYHLRVFLSVFATLDDFIIITGYLLAFYFVTIRDHLKKVVKWKEKEMNREESKGYATFKDSTRVTSPSSTFYSIQHTGEFTSVSQSHFEQN